MEEKRGRAGDGGPRGEMEETKDGADLRIEIEGGCYLGVRGGQMSEKRQAEETRGNRNPPRNDRPRESWKMQSKRKGAGERTWFRVAMRCPRERCGARHDKGPVAEQPRFVDWAFRTRAQRLSITRIGARNLNWA